MSYAIRNTIILLATLLMIVGLGFAYFKFYVDPRIRSLTEEVATKQIDFNSKQNTSSQFPVLNERYQSALTIIANYDKALYASSKPDHVFGFLNRLNRDGGNQLSFDFVFSDTLPESDYGVIQSNLAGFGNYPALTTFVNKIENSQLLNKITAITISPGRVDDNENDVNFSITLDSYYQKTQLFDSLVVEYKIMENPDISTYNPLYPLIQNSVPPNTEGLLNAESSRIVGITANRVFLTAQDGAVVSLQVGDKVYLGYLASINIQNKTATFNLNKGGIQEVVTLEVTR